MQPMSLSARPRLAALLAMLAVTVLLGTSASASSESVIYNFNSVSGGSDGYYPYAGMIADKKGNLYGTTYQGGNTTAYGVVFELTLSGSTWSETVLHPFAGGTSDGAYPETGLVMDASGNLYGTTYEGGTYNEGVVFKLTKSGNTWTETILHSFAGYPKDGSYPLGNLVFDSSGNLYGTTYYGGSHNYGTAFIMTQSKGKWTEKVMHGFAASGDGYYPLGVLVVGKDGYFYGTTEYGGATYNAGTVYELFQARGVWVKKTVFEFTGGAAGCYPLAGLAMDTGGNLYGTTYQCGNDNLGTVFELKAGKNNKFTQQVLYSFTGGDTDGEYPYFAGVVLDSKNNVYGTTYEAGSQSNAGTVYELKLNKGKYKESVLHAFSGGSGDGCYSRAGLVLLKGNVYGTAYACGSHSGGVAFEVIP